MCPICNYNYFSFLPRGYRKCSRCETLCAISLPRTQEIVRVIEESSVGVVNEQRNALLENDYLERFNRFKKYLKKKGNLLDFGCGAGLFVRFILSKGYKAKGFDKSRELSNYLKRSKVPIFRSVNQIPKNHFNVVTSFDVIEHTIDPYKFIKEIKNKLSKKGVLVLTTPNPCGISARVLKHRWWVFGPGAHFILFSIKSLKYLLEREGFEVLKIRTDTITPWFTPSDKLLFKIFNKIVYLFIYPFKKAIFGLYLGDNIEIIARERN